MVLVLCTILGFAGGVFLSPQLKLSSNDWPILHEAYQILVDHGYQPAPEAPGLEYGMIRGMVQAYNDPYTMFVEPAQHELESNTLQGSFGGIGVRIVRDSENHILLYPLPDSPAQAGGIREGDRLLKIGEMEINQQITDDQIQAALRGPVGERVKVTVARPPDYEPVEYSIKRAQIPLPSVAWHLDPDSPTVGLIEVNVVAASTPDEIRKAMDDLKSRGAEAFVLDLRDNYGGLLNAGVDTARLFLKDGVVIEQKYKGREVESFSVEKPGPYTDTPLAVLVNENTASAAEIIAGSLKAHGRAKLIGKSTYGKDTIQLVFDLQDGSSLHVTSAHWWIPGLAPMEQGNGVQPDLAVENNPESNGPDPVARAAANLLLGK